MVGRLKFNMIINRQMKMAQTVTIWRLYGKCAVPITEHHDSFIQALLTVPG